MMGYNLYINFPGEKIISETSYAKKLSENKKFF